MPASTWGKADLVAHVLPAGQDARFANTPAGIARLLGQLAGLEGPVIVVFEGSEDWQSIRGIDCPRDGGYEHALWQALAGAGFRRGSSARVPG